VITPDEEWNLCMCFYTNNVGKKTTNSTDSQSTGKQRREMVLNMQGQRAWGPHAKGGPAHTDETCRGVLQQGQRTGNPGLLDHID